MKDFDKTMEELKKSLSGLDDKIAKQISESFDKISESFKRYKNFNYNGSGNGDEAKNSQDFVFHMQHKDNEPESKDNAFNFSFGDSQQKTVESDDEFVRMAPFLDEESLHELVVEFCESDLQTDMKKILPHLEEEDVGLIMAKFSGGVAEFKGLRPNDLFPFAPEESFDKLFMEKFLNGEMDKKLASYVSDDCWHELVVRYCENEESNLNIDELYPFLDDDDLKLLFRTYLKRRKNKKD